MIMQQARQLSLAVAMIGMVLGSGGRTEAGGINLSTPAGLSPGDSFRFVFVTDGTTDATSTNIADYNAFVNAQAGGATYDGSVITWDAIASTSATAAIDNIGQTLTPVYLADGTLVTTSTTTSGMWSDSLLNPISEDLAGVNFPTDGSVLTWTGTEVNGTNLNGFVLGSLVPIYGIIGDTAGGAWVDAAFSISPASPLQMYGISQVLVVPGAAVPEPSSLLLAGIAAIVGCGLGRSRRRGMLRRRRPAGPAGAIG